LRKLQPKKGEIGFSKDLDPLPGYENKVFFIRMENVRFSCYEIMSPFGDSALSTKEERRLLRWNVSKSISTILGVL